MVEETDAGGSELEVYGGIHGCVCIDHVDHPARIYAGFHTSFESTFDLCWWEERGKLQENGDQEFGMISGVQSFLFHLIMSFAGCTSLHQYCGDDCSGLFEYISATRHGLESRRDQMGSVEKRGLQSRDE